MKTYWVTITVRVVDEQTLMKAAYEKAEAEQCVAPETVEDTLIWLIDDDLPPLDCGFEIAYSCCEEAV